MKGVQVERFNPSHQYDAFARNPVVVKTVNEKGTDCLPLIVLNGKIVSSGRYPDRRELAAWAELSEPTHHESSRDDESSC